jgi:hypothetical protein
MLGAVVHYLREYRRHKLPAFILQDKASTDQGQNSGETERSKTEHTKSGK